MRSKYTEHDLVNVDEVKDGTNDHSLPNHPTLESFRSISKNNRPQHIILMSLSFILIGILIGFLATKNIIPGDTSKSPLLSSKTMEFAPLPPKTEALTNIAFGSCINQNYPQAFWDTVASTQPNITILGGDNVYADCDSIETCPSTLQAAYEKQGSNPSFMGAMKLLPTIATLDNHDYGLNNADRNNPYKDIAKRYFLDFFQVPPDDERRKRRDGVYTSYMYGDVNQGTALQIILLDVRHACSEMGGAKNKNNDTETMLGDAQWQWLQEQFSQPANVRIVVSSIQVIATGHRFFCWTNISSKELQRFYQFISDNSPFRGGTTILLSGDRHVGGIYRHNLTDGSSSSNNNHTNGKSSVLYEITASSFTHTIPLPPAVPDKYCYIPGGSTAEECDDPDSERLHPYVRVNHFASIQLDWNRRIVTADLIRIDPTPSSHVQWVSDAGESLQRVEIELE